MNTVQVCKTLLEVLISLIIQSSVVVGAALAASKWLGRRSASYQALILRSAIVAVFLCAALSFGIAGHIHTLFSLSLPPAQVQAISSVAAAPSSTLPASSWNYSQVAAANVAVGHSVATPVPFTDARPVIQTYALPMAISVFRLSWVYVAGAVIWLAGALALMIWLLACQCHLFQIARRSTRVSSGPAWEVMQNLLRESTKRPRLLASPAVKSPFLAGVWRPTIFLPADIDRYFDQEALLVVLVHELCHLRRCDTVWILLARLARILLWLQPLMWVLERSLLDASEAVCDAEVIRQGQVSASRYADCLVEMAERMAMPPALRAVGLGVLPFRSSLGKRVQGILSGTRSFIRPITPALRMATAIGAATLALAGALLVTARNPSRAAAGESATSIVQQYLDDLSNNQIAQAYALISPASQSGLSLQTFQSGRLVVYPNAAGESPRDASLLATNGLFNDPHATSYYRFEVVGPSTSDPNRVTLRVYPPGITLEKSFTLDVVTVPDPAQGGAPRIDIDKTLVLIDPNAPQEMAARAKSVECVNHLKQLALAALEYAQDHNEYYPDASRWAEEIRPYMMDKTAFNDPLDPRAGSWGFAFNRNLSHVQMPQLSGPAQTVLFFESTANRKNASDTGQSLPKPGRLDGGSYYAFADGHVKRVQDGVYPSFSIKPEQASAAPQTFRVTLNGVQPGQRPKVYLQIVDPNSKYQQGTSFNPRPDSTYLGVQYAPASNFKKSTILIHVPAEIVKSGMLVVRVVPGSPAASAGIQRDDIILEVDGKSLNGNVMLLRTEIANHKPGQSITLVVYSHGKSRQIIVTLEKAPARESAVPVSPHVIFLPPMSQASLNLHAKEVAKLRAKRHSINLQLQLLSKNLAHAKQRVQADRHSPARSRRDGAEEAELEKQIGSLLAEQYTIGRRNPILFEYGTRL